MSAVFMFSPFGITRSHILGVPSTNNEQVFRDYEKFERSLYVSPFRSKI